VPPEWVNEFDTRVIGDQVAVAAVALWVRVWARTALAEGDAVCGSLTWPRKDALRFGLTMLSR
jgi:hypothetical protein